MNSDEYADAADRSYGAIISDAIRESWRQWARLIIAVYASYALGMDLVFWVHRYVYEIQVIGNPLAGIPTWKLAGDTILWAGVLYWLYRGGLENE